MLTIFITERTVGFRYVQEGGTVEGIVKDLGAKFWPGSKIWILPKDKKGEALARINQRGIAHQIV